MTIRIVVAQRGWVFVGDVNREEHEIVITRAKNIRRWGTKRGLAELSAGPTSATELDDGGTVRLHPLQIVLTIDCDAKKWEKHLGK
jgi:hypothetical protein